MSSPHFDQLGTYLVAKTSALQMQSGDLPFVRQWLDDAPTHASPGSMASWGAITANLVQYLATGDRFDAAEPDAQRLGAYLEAMRALDPSVWWMDGPRQTRVSNRTGADISIITKPVYRGFFDVCEMLAYSNLRKSNPLLKQLVENDDWSPTPLLYHLDKMREEQIRQVGIEHDCSATIGHIAQGYLLSALRPLVLDTRWRPDDTPIYGDTWLCHENSARQGNLVQAQRGREFVQRLAKSTPSQVDKMLTFILWSSDLIGKDIADFFPLRLGECNAQPTLHALVGIMIDENERNSAEKARAVTHELSRHHPELLHLLNVHLSIFPEANRITSMAEVLVSGFDALRGRTSDTGMVVGPGVFDETAPST